MKKILLVDDENLMVQLLKLYLEPHGYYCEIMTSGRDAIQYMKKNTVDLVLMDVMMPDKNGWETVQEIRSISSVPILMLTARDQFSDIVNSINNGANGHITKPFDEKRLLYHIEKVLKDERVLIKDLNNL